MYISLWNKLRVILIENNNKKESINFIEGNGVCEKIFFFEIYRI